MGPLLDEWVELRVSELYKLELFRGVNHPWKPCDNNVISLDGINELNEIKSGRVRPEGLHERDISKMEIKPTGVDTPEGGGYPSGWIPLKRDNPRMRRRWSCKIRPWRWIPREWRTWPVVH